MLFKSWLDRRTTLAFAVIPRIHELFAARQLKLEFYRARRTATAVEALTAFSLVHGLKSS